MVGEKTVLLRRPKALVWMFCLCGMLVAFAWFAAAVAFWGPHVTRPIVIFALGLMLPMLFVPLGVLILSIWIDDHARALQHEALALATNARLDRERMEAILRSVPRDDWPAD